MWEYVEINTNGDYVLQHPTLGKMTVGAYSVENTNGAHNITEAITIANNAFE